MRAVDGLGTRAVTIVGARVRAAVIGVLLLLAVLSVVGSFGSGAGSIIAYVLAVCLAPVVILLVAKEHPNQGRAWLLIGGGAAVWALGGFLQVMREEAGMDAIPPLLEALCYGLGYVPVLFGLAALCNPHLRVRRATTAIDGVLLFLALYAVLWLTVVERASSTESMSRVDIAFNALYPAGDLAAVMLAVRLVSSRAARRQVAAMLLAGVSLTAVADVAWLVLYLSNPYQLYPVVDLIDLAGRAAFAVAALWSLLPAPPPVPTGAASSRRLAYLAAVSSLLPPLVLLFIVLFTDREIAVGPVAAWVLVAVGAAVARQMAGVKEQERLHQKSLWLASHDPTTEMLLRNPFLHELSDGGVRDRSGTVLVVEVLGLHEVRDAHGHEAVEFIIGTTARRLRAEVSDNAVFARLAHDQLACFLHSTGSARGREVAVALQRVLASGVEWNGVHLELAAIFGIAQADGVVIDGAAGLRRALQAGRRSRSQGVGFIAVDAELTGSATTLPGTGHSLVKS